MARTGLKYDVFDGEETISWLNALLGGVFGLVAAVLSLPISVFAFVVTAILQPFAIISSVLLQ